MLKIMFFILKIELPFKIILKLRLKLLFSNVVLIVREFSVSNPLDRIANQKKLYQ